MAGRLLLSFIRSLTVLLFILVCNTSYGLNPKRIAESLYTEKNDQIFTENFFKIVLTHKASDPFLEVEGPNVTGYSLDKIPFAFMINDEGSTVDLVVFNLIPTRDLNPYKDKSLSALYGTNVFLFKNISKKLLITQSGSITDVSNFSYIWGKDYLKSTIGRYGNFSDESSPPPFFANQLPDTHPLRTALGNKAMALYSPKRRMLMSRQGISSVEQFDLLMNQVGSFDFGILLMLIHETYHMKEGIDFAAGSEKSMFFTEIDFSKLRSSIQNDQLLGELVITYTQIIFQLSKGMARDHIVSQDIEQLMDLSAVIQSIKNRNRDMWNFIVDYEYVEGFAEYVGIHSLITAQIYSLDKILDFEQNISPNNITYRTGALGGMYIFNKIKRNPFERHRRATKGVWEIIIGEMNIKKSSSKIEVIKSQFEGLIPVDKNEELRRILEYIQDK